MPLVMAVSGEKSLGVIPIKSNLAVAKSMSFFAQCPEISSKGFAL